MVDETRAGEILGGCIYSDNHLGANKTNGWIYWDGEENAELGDNFTADQLEAIAWWMRNKKVEK